MSTKSLLFQRMQIYWRNYRTRRALRCQLHNMSSRELDSLVRDIGIPSTDLLEEANKPIWRAEIPKDGGTKEQQAVGVPFLARNYCKYPPTA
ncbi:DUF1127 domain-containing protein [Marinobacter arenosus]|uniref:DUF1127 domain-containing protein n=1 Tax=Marinobacter arenosus TaxID=2856822 RepID=UPI001C4D74DA|nr:hypothetical protein [Marinobacter arenosus]MBW0146230.1 hypothetical protein [Marinobacter arenosus]